MVLAKLAGSGKVGGLILIRFAKMEMIMLYASIMHGP